MTDSKRSSTYNIEGLLARSSLYRALSKLFRHPNDWRMPDGLLTEETFLEWKNAGHFLERQGLLIALDPLIHELRKFTYAAWNVEYEALFGNEVRGAVPPYELEYGEEHSFREPRQLADISAFYEAFGVRLDRQVMERVDHIAVECAYLHYMTFKQASALETSPEKAALCDNAVELFLKEHLSLWFPVFLTHLKKIAKQGLYHRLADFAECFLQAECALWSIIPGPASLCLREAEEPVQISCETCPSLVSIRGKM